MAEAAAMRAVLEAPGVKGLEVLRLPCDDDTNEKDAVTDLIRRIVVTADPPVTSAFSVLNLGKVVELFAAWRRGLKGVPPYYAVKCNTNPALLGALAALGAGFDCASPAEMDAVLALGVTADRIIYAPMQARAEHAASVGVNLTTFDSSVGGVAFHVGSAVSRVGVYDAAVEAARAVFDAAAARGTPPMRILDIGGGFKAGTASTFQDACDVINSALTHHFGDVPGLQVIGEPGRYFAETPFTLAARVFGKRTRGEVREYWIDDGFFGTLCCVHVENYVPRPVPVSSRAAAGDGDGDGGGESDETHPSTVFGPTCDSLDVVVKGYHLPELRIGDWLVFHEVGAYTTVLSCNFNGFSASDMKTYLVYSSV
ncbi:unnamed protein product [Miscanthus lutarioriparius]|uniref:ornithine decarboxylase n=1 Tax=Miscanthus lutarioriparius TaxID=422564 RepID=A0A811N2V8_9POAL|nr:unnamed protein product [Miscanthus lutarioriparius]